MLQRLAALSVMAALLVTAGCGGDSSNGKKPKSFAEQIADAKKESDPLRASKKLVKIAEDARGKGYKDEAKTALKEALGQCKEVSDPAAKATQYAAIAAAYEKVELRFAAREALKDARAAAGEIKDPVDKVNVLGEVASTLADLDDKPEASETLKQAEAQVEQVKSDADRPGLLSLIAAGYKKLGNAAEAKRVMDAALKAAGALEKPKQQCDALIGIAAKQAEVDKKTAVATLEQAVQQSQQLDPYGRCFVLMDAAKEFSELKRYSRAHEVLKMAEAAAQDIGQPDLNQQTLEKVRELMGTLPKAG